MRLALDSVELLRALLTGAPWDSNVSECGVECEVFRDDLDFFCEGGRLGEEGMMVRRA